uniref:Uncharacterized protein n=1 Tax=Chelydra serpentina TaxID=8475 RepID=A0A8C3T086_CHESE
MAKDRLHVQHRYIELFLNSSPKRKQDSSQAVQGLYWAALFEADLTVATP